MCDVRVCVMCLVCACICDMSGTCDVSGICDVPRAKDNTTVYAIALTGSGGPKQLPPSITLACVVPAQRVGDRAVLVLCATKINFHAAVPCTRCILPIFECNLRIAALGAAHTTH